jgi:hypothetical protein
MKFIGFSMILFSLFLSFGIIVSSLKEGDGENIYKYLRLP